MKNVSDKVAINVPSCLILMKLQILCQIQHTDAIFYKLNIVYKKLLGINIVALMVKWIS